MKVGATKLVWIGQQTGEGHLTVSLCIHLLHIIYRIK